MGYVLVSGPCYTCKKVISFHPNRVPSVRIDGQREPVCLDCIERANPERVKNGLDPIVPHADAYRGANEDEVHWN